MNLCDDPIRIPARFQSRTMTRVAISPSTRAKYGLAPEPASHAGAWRWGPINRKPCAASAAQSPAGPRATVKVEALAAVNINTASVKELDALPGIGARTAALIVEYRQKNGPFKKIEDVREAGATSLNAAAFGRSRWRGGYWRASK
jgi:competence ComEA-like helix-hairpin-helix protein